MDKSLFEQARPILEQIQDNGFEAYYVGGSVRDYVMGRNIHDIDITTSATPDEIESIFSHTIPVGKEHGTINVVFNDENYEVTTFRAEEDYVDHRRPSGVTFVRDLYEDLQRRDFTMNAIAMDTAYKLYDYFDGQQDINNRIIRTVGIAEERFQEDALRMIRCLRFQSQLSFDIATETFEAMRIQMADIKFLSIERIVIELTKLMRGINVEKSFNHLKSLKAFNYMPYFEHLDMNQINVTEAIDLELLIAIVSVKFDINYSLKPLKLSNRQVKDINQYIQIMNALPSIITKEQLKMFVYDYDTHLIKNVMVAADVIKANDIQGHEPLIVNLQTIDETLHRLPMHNRKDMMVNGGVLMAHLNAKSGPWLKDVLRQIEIAIVTGKVSNEETEILKWVDNHVKKYSQDVLQLLYKNKPNYISGQSIAESLNISRTAVKVIDQLKLEGCKIDSVNHKGHLLQQLPDIWYQGIIDQYTKSSALFDFSEVYDSIDSTQLAAKKSLVGNQSSFFILSDEQTKGRGRFNRHWSSSKGQGLWMSVVLRPNVAFSMISKFNLFIALGIRDAIQHFSQDEVKVKWPNDIYIDNGKVCGFLTEMVANNDGIEAIICGIGINLTQQLENFDESIRHRATSVQLHDKNKLDRYQFLERLLQEIEKRYNQFLTLPFSEIREEYIAASNIWNRTLLFTENDKQFKGQAIDLDYDGYLIVRDEAGESHRLISADIDF